MPSCCDPVTASTPPSAWLPQIVLFDPRNSSILPIPVGQQCPEIEAGAGRPRIAEPPRPSTSTSSCSASAPRTRTPGEAAEAAVSRHRDPGHALEHPGDVGTLDPRDFALVDHADQLAGAMEELARTARDDGE
jgi:hypothetical protein